VPNLPKRCHEMQSTAIRKQDLMFTNVRENSTAMVEMTNDLWSVRLVDLTVIQATLRELSQPEPIPPRKDQKRRI
jgi:hypothetical protein